MKMFGTFLLMSLLSLPLFVQAAGNVSVMFPVTVVCAASDPVRYADGSALVEKECLAVVYVFNVEDPTNTPFTIDAAGQLKATSLTADVRWGKISTYQNNLFDIVGAVAGVPQNPHTESGVSGLYSFRSMLLDTDFEEPPFSATAYLVAMDTRFGDKTCKGAPKYIAAYGVSYLGTLSLTSPPVDPFMVGTQAVSGLSNVSMPSLTCPSAPMSLSGELEKLLTPTLSTMVSTADGMTLSFSIAAAGEAPILYTLQTKAALSEPWVNFETIAEKKALANFQPGGYTRFQIEGQKVLSIPRIADEATRFYRVVGE